MAFFDFVEKFFFISLAITFILIIMLVYHFKDRISLLEGKCDALYDIANNLVKQMNTMNMIQSKGMKETPISNTQLDKSYYSSQENLIINSVYDHKQVSPSTNSANLISKIVVSDSESDSDTDSDSDSGSDTGSEDGDDVDDDVEFENENFIQIEKYAVIMPYDMEIEEIEELKDIEEVEEVEELKDIDEIEDIEVNISDEIISEDRQIDKEDTKTEVSIPNVEVTINTVGEDYYKKLETSVLKQLAIERNLATSSEVKKLKKIDLVKLLSAE